MIKIAICDDEKNIRSYLASLIRRQSAECEITEYDSGETCLSEISECDLLFLDIELGEISSQNGMNGLRLARHIREMSLSPQPLIIFVTGHEKYVYDAFDVDAFQYLVKPIDEQKFAGVFDRAAERILRGKEMQSRKLVIQYAGTSKVVAPEDILYMESQGHKVILHLREGRLEYYANLGVLEKEMQGQFSRIHKGYLVNLAQVESYSRSEVTMTNGDRLAISKYKYADFAKTHLRFIQKQ